jgi:hypothetical protein
LLSTPDIGPGEKTSGLHSGDAKIAGHLGAFYTAKRYTVSNALGAISVSETAI